MQTGEEVNTTREEKQRIAFITARDGYDEGIEFAKQTMKIYRKAVLSTGRGSFKWNQKKHHASTREFRETFILSYLALKECVMIDRNRKATI